MYRYCTKIFLTKFTHLVTAIVDNLRQIYKHITMQNMNTTVLLAASLYDVLILK